jgi:hypothetical protein
MAVLDDDNPYAAPKSESYVRDPYFDATSEAWRRGHLLVVRKGAVLADRCLKCGAPTEGYQFSRTVSWHRPIYYLVFFLISPLLYVLIYFFVRWQAHVTVSLCPRHRKNRVLAIALGWLFALAGVGMFIAMGMLSDAWNFPDSVRTIMAVTGIVLLLGGIIGGIVGSRVLDPKLIDEHFVCLSKVSPAFLAKLPDWNSPGEFAP